MLPITIWEDTLHAFKKRFPLSYFPFVVIPTKGGNLVLDDNGESWILPSAVSFLGTFEVEYLPMSRPDDEQSLQSQPEKSDERSLIARSEQTSPEGLLKSSLLELTGFSPRLPQLFWQLNDALTKIAPPISRVGIKMTPGKMPVVETHLEHGDSGYTVEVVSFSGLPHLSIATTDPLPEFMLSLDEVKKFAHITVTDVTKEIFLVPIIEAEGFEMTELDDVTEKMLASYMEPPTIFVSGQKGTVKTRVFSDLIPEFAVEVEGQSKPLLRLVANRSEAWDKGKSCFGLAELFYEGNPQDIERILELASQLFNRQI